MEAGICIVDPAVAANVCEVISCCSHKIDAMCFKSGRSLCEAVSTGFDPALVVLGLERIFLHKGELSNLQSGIYLRKNCAWGGVMILISEKFEYDSSIFDLQPLYYLTLPLDTQKLKTYIVSVASDELQRETSLVCKTREGRNAIPTRRIRYISSLDRKILIYSTVGKYEAYMKLEDAARRVGDDFIQTHQSFLVNRTYIVKVFRDHVELDDDQQIPISRKYQRDVLSRYFL